jgi:RNA-directed DNA polymerase
MTYLAQLRAITTKREFAHLLGYSYRRFCYVLYGPTAGRYSTFEIPKRSGGTRTIVSPNADLKSLQRALADLLENCLNEILNEGGQPPPSRIAHGFVRGASIFTNAHCHKNKRYVFNIDLEDFFGTIHFGRVQGFFVSNKHFSLPKEIATLLANIACFDGKLPQGSPCSPIISNLIGHLLDIRLVALAAKVGCTYTRYADDLTFSTNKKLFPAEIATPSAGDPNHWMVGGKLADVIGRADFRINPNKTRMQYEGSRQVVTGLTVNRRVNTKAEYRHNLRAMVMSLYSKGAFVVGPQKTPGRFSQLSGMLNFVDQADGFVKKRQADIGKPPSPEREFTSRERTYRKFLFYREFFGAEKPVIICEGETDNIYLKSALHSLIADFPSLIERDAQGKPRIKLHFFKRGEAVKRKLDLLGMTGGADQFRAFIQEFLKRDATVSPHLKRQPTIILLDNDKGTKYLYPFLRQTFDILANKEANDPFIKIGPNLYLVFTPLSASGGDTAMEDFFPADVLARELNGKKFNPSNTAIDDPNEYGKMYFARYVVLPDKTIDFSAFRAILARVQSAIEAHYA